MFEKKNGRCVLEYRSLLPITLKFEKKSKKTTMMSAKKLSLTPSNISEVSMVVLRIDFFTGFLTAVEELQVKVNRG